MEKLKLIQDKRDELLKIEHDTFGLIKQYTIDIIEEIEEVLEHSIEELSYSEDAEIITDLIFDISLHVYKIDTLLEICNSSMKDYEVLKKVLNILETINKLI